MITKIEINGLATYKEKIEITPKKLNFIYGSNGSGKTTISNLLGGYTNSIDSSIEMSDQSIKVLTYNRNFVLSNFGNVNDVPGVFTLGENTKVAQEKLADLAKKNKDTKDDIELKQENILQLRAEIKKEEEKLEEICWGKQKELGESFKDALIGVRNSKEAFRKRCYSTYEQLHKKDDGKYSLELIKEKYDRAFDKNSQEYHFLDLLDTSKVEEIESCELLKKIITGSKDSPFGDIISYLNNSDWVKVGTSYLEKNAEECPFCQQSLNDNIKKNLKEYFDEKFQEDCQQLNKFIENYMKYFGQIKDLLIHIVQNQIPILEYSMFQDLIREYDRILDLNIKKLNEKQISPSMIVDLSTFTSLFKEINVELNNYNKTIKTNNDIVKNQEEERDICRNILWEYFVYELWESLDQYKRVCDGRNKGIENLLNKIDNLEREVGENKAEIKELEKSLTSVAPTAIKINEILTKFDFKGFQLQENPNQAGTYVILREDGSEAKDSLSEGEYNFITFLYFYYLVYGSHEQTGITQNKIIVIDDPISSLDSNVLFIVSTLVKNLINHCRHQELEIQQIFLLTHNVYFHKEITFLGSRNEYKKDEAYFGIIKKIDNISTIKSYEKNPIQTTYELLWQDLKEVNNSATTIFNTMRRILEYYFQILGGIKYEDCINEFDGNDKLVCKALISCINDSSHFISDDFVLMLDESNIGNYRSIFHLIFQHLGHSEHYNMMMNR
ncbi:AAA family ATPase [Listeria goaensis]|uniref:AAA family ATPase n=1 Tax=Listeria goaensis TaxID=1649188 RepID=UPI0019673DFF|nr:AAA family ATPase [Listeria goaensis]